ncbi:MAG: TolC family protein [Bacteroidetes bacterium]|nr:TolC family protein [Bacteroidota bacterium]
MQIHRRSIHILACVLILCSGKIFAQDSISLKQAINIAFTNNSQVTTLQNSYQSQQYNIDNAKGSLFPTLSLSGGYSRNISSTKGGVIIDQNGIPRTVDASTNGNNTFSLGLNSGVTLYNGMANFRNVDLQQANLASIVLNLETTKKNIMLTVTSTYIDILKKMRIVVANQDNLQVSLDQLNSVKAYMEVGKKTLSDVYKQDVLVSQNEFKLEVSKNDVNKAKVDLLFAMNDNINRDYNVRQNDINTNLSVADLRTIVDRTSNITELVNRAKTNRFEYKFAMQQIEINEITLDIAKRNLYFPTISGSANYNWSGDAISNMDANKVLTLGINLSYPIFQGYTTKVREQIAEVNVKQKREDLRQLEQQITNDVKKAHYDLETAYKQYEILERSLVSAQQDVLLSQESYKVGLNTLLDVQTAQNNLNSILVSRITALYDFITAKARLDYYTGELNY